MNDAERAEDRWLGEIAAEGVDGHRAAGALAALRHADEATYRSIRAYLIQLRRERDNIAHRASLIAIRRDAENRGAES
jgi:hypothetical protein